jgi:uridine monophosphate synthetase
MMEGLNFDCIAGIPMAGVPLATAVSLLLKRPMIFPRLTSKGHGSGRMVEGLSNRGDRAVLLDDLITTGKSKLEAVKILQCEGLKVEDLVVLVERGTSGRKELEEAGIRLHAYLDIDEILKVCREMGRITDIELRDIKLFVRQS